MEEKKAYHYKIEPRIPFGYDGYLYSISLCEYYMVAEQYFTKRGCKKAIIRYIKRKKRIEKRRTNLLHLHGTIEI